MISLLHREKLGLYCGWGLGILTGIISLIRQSRMFHPRGLLFLGEVQPEEEYKWISNHAMVRFSSAWWKNKEWVDVLGIAVRFSNDKNFTVDAKPSDQDLLFATIRHPWTLPLAPFTTDFHDFLKNHYYTVSPFNLEGNLPAGLIEFALIPAPLITSGTDRKEKLENAIQSGTATFELKLKKTDLPESSWKTVATLTIKEPIQLNQERLRFDPFRTGLGIRPRGFVQYLRVGAYRASQFTRPRC